MKRVFHTWDKWECFPAGFYNNKPRDKSLDDDECRRLYGKFLRNIPLFEATMESLLRDWPNSCEHYLSNDRMNRIAWLGQAAMCYATGVPAQFRGGFNQLSDAEQATANEAALRYLNKWLASRGEEALTMEQAASRTEADLY